MSSSALAKRLGVPRTRIDRIVKGQISITPDTAFRLAKAFKAMPYYWMNMQTSYDLALAGTTVGVSDIQSLDTTPQVKIVGYHYTVCGPVPGGLDGETDANAAHPVGLA